MRCPGLSDGEAQQDQGSHQCDGAHQRIDHEQGDQEHRDPRHVKDCSRSDAGQGLTELIQVAQRLSACAGLTTYGSVKETGEYPARHPLVQRDAVIDQDARPQVVNHAGDHEDKQRDQGQAPERRLTLAGENPPIDLERVERQCQIQDVRDQTEAEGHGGRPIALTQRATQHIVRKVREERQEFHFVQSAPSDVSRA